MSEKNSFIKKLTVWNPWEVIKTQGNEGFGQRVGGQMVLFTTKMILKILDVPKKKTCGR